MLRSDPDQEQEQDPDPDPELDVAGLVQRLGLEEELGEGGGPRLVLTCELRGQVETIGSLRRFIGNAPARSAGPVTPLERDARGEREVVQEEREVRGDRSEGDDRGGSERLELLELRLGVPILGLTMERVIGFAGRASVVPHILFSVVTTGAPGAPGASTLTADLLPRLDLMIHPTYADGIYGPLAAELEEFARRSADACDEVSVVLEGPLAKRLLVSPWASRLTAVAGPPALRSGLFRVYSERWVELLLGSAGALASARGSWEPEPGERDRRLRAALSEARSDPLWRELTRLCGPEQADAVRAFVRGDG